MRSTIHSILFNVIVLSLFISYVVVAIKVEDSKSNNNHNHNIWSPVPTIFWTFDKTNKVINTVTAPKYENDILSMDTVVERFNTQLFNNNAAKHLIIGFLYYKLNTQEFSKYIVVVSTYIDVLFEYIVVSKYIGVVSKYMCVFFKIYLCSF